MKPPASLLLADPRVVVAALPHLLGFHPRESLVCLWLAGNELVVLQRADLPEVHLPEVIDEYLDAYLAPARQVRCDGVVPVCVTKRSDLASEVAILLPDVTPVHVRGLLITDGSRVRDARARGRWNWISTADRQHAAEMFAASCHQVAGAPLRDRAQVVAEVEFDPSAVANRPPRDWGDESRAMLSEALRSGPDAILRDTHLVAQIGVHVQGRDALLWWAAHTEPARRRELLDGVLSALRATPPGCAANLASLCAAVAWMCGDGVRANAAVDRCLAEDGDHILGRMIEAAMVTAVPPSSFIDMVQQIEARTVGLDEGCVDVSLWGGYSLE